MVKTVGDRRSLWVHLMLIGMAVVLMGMLPNPAAGASDSEGGLFDFLENRVAVHGFVREGISMNTQDWIETPQDDAWDLSMVRSTLYAEANVDVRWGFWKGATVIGRLDAEYLGSALKNIDDLYGKPASLGTDADLWDEYSNADLREYYADFQFGDRLYVRLGKQQVVWGKTDFFRGLDIVHGFDYTWRSFLEPENEQLRKPLIMGNFVLQIPELKGSAQAIVRPGIDRDKDIGNTYDLFGGRWANQSNKGVNFLDLLPYNLDWYEGEQSDPTYGFRWSGTALGFEYTIDYLHTFQNDPVVNSIFNPWQGRISDIKGTLGDLVYPQVDLLGGTINYYIPALDIVARAEVSYSWNNFYNYGTKFLGGALPGFAGLKEKDVMRIMAGFDKNIRPLQDLLHADTTPFFTFQVFDTWIMNFDEKDDLVFNVGWGAPANEHTTTLTAVLSWGWYFNKIQPTLAWGIDAVNGGGFFIPAVEFLYGDHWRLRLEYDMFYYNASRKPGEIENKTYLFGYFANNDQLYFRLTYQF
jgi:hypothetical protein